MAGFGRAAFDPLAFSESSFSFDAPVQPSFARRAFWTLAFDEQAFSFDAAEEVSQTGIIPSGGVPHDYPRTKKDIRRDRERFGIPDEERLEEERVARVIADVAARQAERLEHDRQKQFEELSRELKILDIEWDGKYLTALNLARERLIDLEIGERLREFEKRKRIQEERDVLSLLEMVGKMIE